MVNWDVPACGHLMLQPLQCMKNWKKPNEEGHLDHAAGGGNTQFGVSSPGLWCLLSESRKLAIHCLLF